jgi:hypothetical protein
MTTLNAMVPIKNVVEIIMMDIAISLHYITL